MDAADEGRQRLRDRAREATGRVSSSASSAHPAEYAIAAPTTDGTGADRGGVRAVVRASVPPEVVWEACLHAILASLLLSDCLGPGEDKRSGGLSRDGARREEVTGVDRSESRGEGGRAGQRGEGDALEDVRLATLLGAWGMDAREAFGSMRRVLRGGEGEGARQERLGGAWEAAVEMGRMWVDGWGPALTAALRREGWGVWVTEMWVD